MTATRTIRWTASLRGLNGFRASPPRRQRPARACQRRARRSRIAHPGRRQRQSRQQQQKTADALDAIARWMEATDQRLQGAQRVATEHSERTTGLVAEAVRTMSERLADLERKAGQAQSQPPREPKADASPAASVSRTRPALSRDTLSAAIVDIRTRQRDLDAGMAQADCPRPPHRQAQGLAPRFTRSRTSCAP